MPDNDYTGEVFPDFGPGLKVVRLLGHGGMGSVYEAVQEKLSRRVAVKVLAPRYAGEADFSARFSREAKSAAAVQDPNVVRVYDFGSAEDGSHFIVMEYVEGEDLAHRLEREGRLAVAEALRIVGEVAVGLRAAHESGIVHRDIKPANIMLGMDGSVKITDLGLAKVASEETGITMTGTGLGSPYFMSPEQAEDAGRVDHRADMYSLGITLFMALTGRHPFDGDSALAIVRAHGQQPIPSGKDVGVPLPRKLDALITRLAAKKPEHRPQDYDELIEEISGMLTSLPAGGGRKLDWGLAVSGVVGAAVVVALMLFVRSRKTEVAAQKGPTNIVSTASPTPVMIPSEPPRSASATNAPRDHVFRDGFVIPRVSDGMSFPTPETWTGRMPFSYQLTYAGPPMRARPYEMLRLSERYARANPEDYMGQLRRFELTYMTVGTAHERVRALDLLRRIVAKMEQEFQVRHLAMGIKIRRLAAEKKYREAYLLWADFPAGLRALKFNRRIREQLQEFIPGKELQRLDEELGKDPIRAR